MTIIVQDKTAVAHGCARRLNAGFEPIAGGTCGHRHRQDGYRPSRALGDLVRARNTTCPAPSCGASSVHCDLDHTRAWPDGDTDECNLGPACRSPQAVYGGLPAVSIGSISSRIRDDASSSMSWHA